MATVPLAQGRRRRCRMSRRVARLSAVVTLVDARPLNENKVRLRLVREMHPER
jgi:hypothetical protein